MNVSNFWQKIMYLNSDFDFQRKKNTKRIECSVLVFQRVLKRVFLLHILFFLIFVKLYHDT